MSVRIKTFADGWARAAKQKTAYNSKIFVTDGPTNQHAENEKGKEIQKEIEKSKRRKNERIKMKERKKERDRCRKRETDRQKKKERYILGNNPND